MKHLRNKSIMSLIYVALLSIPLVSILSRVIYVQSNKNAYLSYSDALIENQVQITNGNQYQEGAILQFNYVDNGLTGTNYSDQYKFDDISLDLSSIFGSSYNSNYNYDTIWVRNDGYVYIKDSTISTSQINKANIWGVSITQFAIKFKGVNTTSLTYGNGNVVLYQYQYKINNLDNVFEYSVNRLVDENNFGKLNFFTWFADLLLDDGQMNMTYVRLANWYMCYALLISLMQILFLVLMWFVNFSRKLLDRGMNYDW